MNPIPLARCAGAVLAAVLAAPVYPATWQSVQAGSKLEFIAIYEGAEAPGQFGRFAVTTRFDPLSLDTSSILVDVDIASASMGNAEMDETIAQPVWFDAAAFPQAEFRSDKIHAVNELEYVAEGILSIKGVKKPVTVPFHWRPKGRDAEMTGSLTLSRVDFGIGSGEWATDTSIGHAVQVRFKVVLEAEK